MDQESSQTTLNAFAARVRPTASFKRSADKVGHKPLAEIYTTPRVNWKAPNFWPQNCHSWTSATGISAAVGPSRSPSEGKAAIRGSAHLLQLVLTATVKSAVLTPCPRLHRANRMSRNRWGMRSITTSQSHWPRFSGHICHPNAVPGPRPSP